MLLVTLVQIVCAIGAVFFGARTAMALGRDVRQVGIPPGERFLGREVGHFGTPSLITRTTNDVQQVQMLALMTFTLMVSAPIMCVGGIILALNQDVPLSCLLLVSVPAARRDRGADHLPDAAAVPADAGADRPDQPGAARADHRRPGHPGLRARLQRAGAFRRRERRAVSTSRWAPAG